MAFDAKTYYEQLITTSSLPTLLKRENDLLTGVWDSRVFHFFIALTRWTEIRQLDSERQSLVYNHHHELIAASDTIAAVSRLFTPFVLRTVIWMLVLTKSLTDENPCRKSWCRPGPPQSVVFRNIEVGRWGRYREKWRNQFEKKKRLNSDDIWLALRYLSGWQRTSDMVLTGMRISIATVVLSCY